MTTTTLKTRIKLKNGTPEEWSQATNFSPLKGELVIYNDADNPRMKVGDGETNINDLPFVNNSVVAADLSDVEEGTEFDPGMINADSLGGVVAEDYATKVYVDDAVSNLDISNNYYIPSVDELGNLTWTPNNDNMPEVASSNIKGKTPVKGTDYYTEADKTEMVQLVLAAMPNASGVSF